MNPIHNMKPMKQTQPDAAKVACNSPRTRPYIGIRHDYKSEIFRASAGPTEDLYGSLYKYVIGPFRTVRGAKFMRDHGNNNPHCRCVAEAERLAKRKACK